MLRAKGQSGPNIDYVLNLEGALEEAGITDVEVVVTQHCFVGTYQSRAATENPPIAQERSSSSTIKGSLSSAEEQ